MSNSPDTETKNFCVGLKQTMRCLKKNNVTRLYIAEDAEAFVIRQVLDIAKNRNLEIKYVKTMKELGEKTKIDTGAAVAAEIVNPQ